MRAPKLPATLGNPECDVTSHSNVMTDPVSLQAAIEFLNALNDTAIAYNPIYSIITGSVTAGLLLSYLCDLSKSKGYSEFSKTEPELRNELAMGSHEVKSAKKKLVDMGVITITRRGSPQKCYFKINSNIINDYTSRAGSFNALPEHAWMEQ